MKKTLKLIGAIWLLMTVAGYAKVPTYYGIVIGCCENYQNQGMKGLNSKVDAEEFYRELVDMYYAGNRNRASKNLHLLTEKLVTRTNVRKTLKKVAKQAEDGDVVYFFYSGHGSSLHDKSRLIAPSYKNNELIKVMEYSGLAVPYDFNLRKVGKTAIIASRDLRDNGGYGFEYLDNKGVKVIMISDSCYSGNMFRNSSNTTSKFIPTAKLDLDYDTEVAKIKQNAKKSKSHHEYRNLIFFSAGGTDKAVAEDDRLKRGKFSLVLEKCLKSANQNNDNIITKKELKECLRTEDTAKAFVVYPPDDRLANQTVFKAKQKNIIVQKRDKIRVKTSIRGLEKISSEIVIDNQNYDIEIIKRGANYQIFRYTGEEYAEVNKENLKKYLNSLKLFKLKGEEKLALSIVNDKRKELGQFCKGEELAVELAQGSPNKYIVALTLNREGTVIMLQPNDYETFSSTLVRTKVEYPFGMDKIKVFSLNSQKQYNLVKQLIVKGGELEDYAVNELYKILKNNKRYKEAEVDIETIDQAVNYCRQGD